MKKILCIICGVTTIIAGSAQQSDNTKKPFPIEINPAFSYKMMEPNEDLRKVFLYANEKALNNIGEKQVIVGSSLIALGDYQLSNTDSKFGYLMRHPTASNQIGKEVSEAVIHSFQLSFSASITNWLGTYAELLYNPEQSFGTGTITSLTRNQIQLRKGFVLIGNLNKFPLYGAIGKMDAPFGQTGSVNPFTNSTMFHAFGGLGYGAQLGFNKWNIHATFMAVQGGAQFRALNTSVGDSTNVPSQLNNFVGDLNYTLGRKEIFLFTVGASYMHGSSYCQEFPISHFNPCVENNPAWTAYGRIWVMKRLMVKGGFARTIKVWPGTHNPTPPLDIYEASKVSSLDAGAKFIVKESEALRHTVSAEFSNFRAGPDGAPWERQNQIVIGYSAFIHHSSKLFVELFRTNGFAPLNFISGSNPFDPFPPGETHSLRDAFSHGVVVGGQITF